MRICTSRRRWRKCSRCERGERKEVAVAVAVGVGVASFAPGPCAFYAPPLALPREVEWGSSTKNACSSPMNAPIKAEEHLFFVGRTVFFRH
jgi:hypothetical protein